MSTFKVIVAGGRNYPQTACEFVFDKIYYLLSNKFPDVEIVSGGAMGVDKLGEEFAAMVGMPCKRFPANWDKHGKAAGPIRNKKMAEYADALVAFWDGQSRGTANMIDTMKKIGKPVRVIRY